MATVLGTTDESWKIPTSSSSSVSGLGDPEEKIHFRTFATKPWQYCWKMSRVGHKTAVLVVIRVRLHGEGAVAVYFPFRIPQTRCRTRAGLGDYSKFLCRAEHTGHLYGAVKLWSPKNRERLQKRGHFHFPPQIFSLFGCRSWWWFHFCYQTGSNPMIWPSSVHSKTTVQRGQFASMQH